MQTFPCKIYLISSCDASLILDMILDNNKFYISIVSIEIVCCASMCFNEDNNFLNSAPINIYKLDPNDIFDLI